MAEEDTRSWKRPLRQLGGGIAAVRLARLLTDGGGADAAAAARVAETLGTLRGPAAKFGQILATLPGVLEEPAAEALAVLRHEAPPMRRLFVRRRLRQALGPDWRSAFRAFEESPRFAASLGQVHRAVLADGRAAAVKIQYPDMETVLAADLANLRLITPALRRLAGIDLGAVVEELSERFGEELDYRSEAAFMRRYRRAVRPFLPPDRLALPAPVDAMTRRRVLTMTWMEGEHLSDCGPRLPQALRDRVAADLLTAWYGPFFAQGLLHGDPHPGNILWQRGEGDNGRLVLLDFGCMRSYTAREVDAVRRLPAALAADERAAIAAALADLGFGELDRPRLDALLAWLDWLFAPFIAAGRRPFLPRERLSEAPRRLAQLRRRIRDAGGIRLPRAFVLLHRSAVVLGGVLARLEPWGDWQALWRRISATPWDPDPG